MNLTRHIAVGSLLVSLAAATALAASTANGAAPPTARAKPVIGAPATTPAQPVAGKGFVVAFPVTRSDNGAPMTSGRMICDPSIAGKVLAHAESFRNGTARLAFAVPRSTTGKLLKVKVQIRVGSASATKVAVFRIVKTLPKPTLTIADASVAEGNATATLSFVTTLSAKSAQTVAVRYATADGTATSPADYAAAGGTLTFRPGETSKAISVTVAGDGAVEQDETLTVVLSGPVNATIADGTATGTITNDDVAPRAGAYRGTTSQGRPVTFTVAPSATGLTNIVFTVDLACTEVPVTLANQQMDLTGLTIPLAGDFGFTWSDSYSDSDGSIAVAFAGKLSVPGSATGTLKVDVALNVSGRTVHCGTGNVTWNAS